MERRYSKDRILELYLNQVYFGNQSYGIEKAARRYFKKSARQLNLGESAVLAGLLKAPEGLSLQLSQGGQGPQGGSVGQDA
ncbi:MAG: biosynthetic peptidoglycan transglycosylase [Vampirovibrionales bacterium]